MAKLEIRLLGQVEICQADGGHQPPLTSACQKLLAYLLLTPGKLCRREVLMDVFWQDSSPNRARSCLNSALWRLRRELRPYANDDAAYLQTTSAGEIGFDWSCDYWLDIQMFEQSIGEILQKPASAIEADEVHQLERSLALYRGDLLEGVYDDWALVARERLRMIYLGALTHLMHYYTHVRMPEQGMEFARDILREDPLREDIHRNMMRLHITMGQRTLAIQQYRICASILDRELGIPPMEETQALYQKILNPGAIDHGRRTDDTAAVLGMEQQLALVADNLDQAHALLRQATQLLARMAQLNSDA